MKHGPDIARVAALIGDPARANMLAAMMSGCALTASELALEAGVTPQTASSHLGKLADAGLITQRKQGRHRYYALASDEVAEALEALMGLSFGMGALRNRPGPKDDALRQARVCYDHLAGEAGVQLYQSLLGRGFLMAEGEALSLTERGASFARELGIDPAGLPGHAPLCRPCLDWSARKSHLAGRMGRAFLARFEALGWLRRETNTRILRFSPEGKRLFHKNFPIL